MHHKQNGLPYSANRVPPQLAVDHGILPKQQTWIGEYSRRRLEINASVLLSI
jgi:hypothetical protein